jgi:hypothetical protein
MPNFSLKCRSTAWFCCCSLRCWKALRGLRVLVLGEQGQVVADGAPADHR